MKHFFLIVGIGLFLLIFLGASIWIINKPLSQTIPPAISYKGTTLTWGYNQNPSIGKPTYTGVVRKFTSDKGLATVEFEDIKQTFLFIKTETFTFDPKTAFSIIPSPSYTPDDRSLPNTIEYVWTILPLDELQTRMKQSLAISLQFEGVPLGTNVQTLHQQHKDPKFAIIFHPYAPK